MGEPPARYANRVDPVARRQLAKLNKKPGRSFSRRDGGRPWGHVPILDLFEQAGNRVHVRPGGRAECGHEPIHGSTSGRCVTIDPDRGIWYCRSCRTGGDVVRLAMQTQGVSGAAAVKWLVARYGPPAHRRGRLPVLEA